MSRLSTQRAARGIWPLVLAVSAAANAERWQPSFDVTMTSDYVYRGVSQTLSRPALQPSVTLAHDSGLYASLWASNIDYVETGDPDDGANLELNTQLGYWRPLTELVSTEFIWTRMMFPSTLDGVDIDYQEFEVALSLADRLRLAVAYSDSSWNSGGESWNYSAEMTWDLPKDLTLTTGLGHFDLNRAFGDAYSYGHVAIGGRLRLLDWTLGYHDTSGSADNIFYESTVEPRLVLTLSYSL